MAAPLEFKRRVRLPEVLDEERAPRRRSLVAPAGVLGWTLTVALAVAIAEGVIPLERWLPERAPLDVAVEPRARATDRTPAALALAPKEPELPAAPPPAALTASPEPEPEPEPLATTLAGFDSDAVEAAPALPAAESDPPLASPAPEPADPPPRTEPERASAADVDEGVDRRHDPPPAVAASGKSCEQAAAEASYSIEIGKGSGPADIDRSAYAAVLDRGSYFEHCGAPESLKIRICAAVQNGAAVGVTVRTTPGMSAVAACIARAVRGLSFPRHPRLDVVTTTFE